MGVETAIGLSLLAASQYASHVNQRNQQRKRDDLLTQQLTENAASQRKNTGIIQNLTQEVAQSTPETERSSLLKAYTDAMKQNAGTANAGFLSPSNNAYNQAAAAAALGVAQEGADRAEVAARVDAPGLQRRREAQATQDARTDLGRTADEVNTNDFLTRLRLQGVRSNPWLSALSAVASGAAKSYTGPAATSAGDGVATFGNNPNWVNDAGLW